MAAAVTDTPDDVAPGGADDRRGGFGSLGSVVHLLVLTWAAAIASFPLNDNSFFTHLATGRIILEERTVPSSDPYTFTALGEPWTVQSWLASIAYAGFEQLGGDVGLRVLVLAVFLSAASLLWHLTAPAPTVIGRLLLVIPALFVMSDLWSERPYMIGVIGLSVVWLALQGQVRPWLLVPLLWIWTNTHGSFPLAVVLCGAVVVGGTLDRRVAGVPERAPDQERRTTAAVLIGVALGAISPIGPKLLAFPLTAMTKSGVFAEVLEWRPPTYQSMGERAFLVLVVMTALLLSRGRPWRLALPAVGFAAMGLYAQRNVALATVVLVAVCALSIPALGSLRAADRPALGRPIAALVGALLVLVGAVCLVTPVDGFGGYPVRALAYLEVADIEGRTATEMPAGNMLAVLDGASGAIFIDDRVDMFPQEVFGGYLTLSSAQANWSEVLDQYEISLVVWSRRAPLAAVLVASPEWRVAFTDSEWMVACQREACDSRP